MSMTVKTISGYKEMCRKIVNLDSNIKFFGIINEHGRFIVGQSRKDAKFLVDEKDREMLFMGASLRMKMRDDFDQTMGSVDFTVTYRRNVIIMKIPSGKNIFYLAADKEFDFCKIPFQILDILKQNENVCNISNN